MPSLESLLTKETLGLGFSGLSLIISILSLVIAAAALWFAHFYRGKIRMIPPSLVYFGFEGKQPKIMLRALLHCTSARGQAVESLYLNVRHNDFSYVFDLHGYTENIGMLIGSGMFVGQNGVNYNLHYLIRSEQPFYMVPGPCKIEAMAKLPHREQPISLSRFSVELKDVDIIAFAEGKPGTLFRRRPDLADYERDNRFRPDDVA